MPAPKLHIVFAGVFDACPKLKFILGHLAEMLPFAMHRLHEHTYYTRRRLRIVLGLIQGTPVARCAAQPEILPPSPQRGKLRA